MRRDVARRLFRGPDLASVGAQARAALGDDAVILGTRVSRHGGETTTEVLAAPAADVARFTRRVTAAPVTRDAGGPFVIALVGPTGAGKTTTSIKLALHAQAFGGRAVGMVTLDTYRAGAVAQLEAYAEVARLPLEVAYDAADVRGALARLAHCDVVVVDTPGRGPRATDDDDPWRLLLAELAPDEVHLVVPATMRVDLAEGLRDRLDALLAGGPRGVTHALLTKLDEVPDEDGVAALAAQLDLPVRWVADGQEIPADLAPGAPRLLAALERFADGRPVDGRPVDVIPLTLDRPGEDVPRRAGASGARATA
jgi:flagellar biosynthesis protein FlhF